MEIANVFFYEKASPIVKKMKEISLLPFDTFICIQFLQFQFNYLER